MRPDDAFALPPDRQAFWSERKSSSTALYRLKQKIDIALGRMDFADAHPIIREACRYSILDGGKRVRPIFILLVGKALGGNEKCIMPIALATELAHTSSLILDDIMDRSRLRRYRATAHLKYGKAEAFMAADYLIFKSMKLVLESGLSVKLRKECMALMCRASANMIEGQWFDMHVDSKISIGDYTDQIYKRSGQFFETGAVLAAKVSGSEMPQIKAVGEMGGRLGVLFQLRDDILDYMGGGNSGKPPFHDFSLGKLTAPVIIAMARLPGKRKEALSLLRKERKTTQDRDRMLSILRQADAIVECQKLLLACAKKGRATLKIMPETVEKSIISDLIDYLCYRVV